MLPPAAQVAFPDMGPATRTNRRILFTQPGAIEQPTGSLTRLATMSMFTRLIRGNTSECGRLS
eukprot:13394620-Alexandrium_andersonii.AAC.1